MHSIKSVTLALVTDCGGTDKGRYELVVPRSFFPYSPNQAFFETVSMRPLHSGFVGMAHAMSTIDMFGPLREGEKIGALFNAAPRLGDQNGHRLRGAKRHKDGEDVFALLLDNGVWVVGPNAGMNFYFIPKNRIKESYVLAGPRLKTPFRSMELMIPALAKQLVLASFPDITLRPKDLVVPLPESGVFLGDWDSHGNMYIFGTRKAQSWLPRIGAKITVRIGGKIARLRHVRGIFAGRTGEETLTTGSLLLNGQNVHYIVVVGGNAHGLFGQPEVGSRVEFLD